MYKDTEVNTANKSVQSQSIKSHLYILVQIIC